MNKSIFFFILCLQHRLENIVWLMLYTKQGIGSTAPIPPFKINNKICTQCNIEKTFDSFYKAKTGKDGLQSKCKDCYKTYQQDNKEKIKEYAKTYQQDNKDKIKEYQKTYQQDNKDKIKEYQKTYQQVNGDYAKTYYQENIEKIKAYNLANKEKIKETKKAYRQANKEKIKEKSKSHYQDNKEKIKEYSKAYTQANKDKRKVYNEANKEKINKYRKEHYQANKEKSKAYYQANYEKIKEWHNKKRQNDPIYRFIHNQRNRLYLTFKRAGIHKDIKTLQYIGCTKEFLKEHIVKQFTSKMNLNNYGVYWEIDHIKPLLPEERLSKKELIKRCHYSNLQPLSKEENRAKGNKELIV